MGNISVWYQMITIIGLMASPLSSLLAPSRPPSNQGGLTQAQVGGTVTLP